MSQTTTIQLSPGRLRALLDHAGLSPSERSPLSGLRDLRAKGGKVPAEQRELLSGEGLHALGVLADPDYRVTAVCPTVEGARAASYFASTTDGRDDLVGCWKEGGEVRISFPLTADDIVGVADEILGAGTSLWTDELDVELRPAGITALCAAVDALREALYDSILRRQVGFELLLTETTLRRQLDLGLSTHDPRWLVTLLASLVPPGAEIRDTLLVRGMKELDRSGLVTRRSGGWEPGDGLARLSVYWRHPFPATGHEAVSLNGNRIVERKHRIAVRGAGPLWAMEFDGFEGTPRARLRSVHGPTYVEELSEMIRPPAARTAAASGMTTPCPACGAFVSPGKFCANCGASLVPAKPRHCTGCGVKLKPNLKFCTSCGQQV